MRSIQTQHTFSLSSVKPLEGLLNYREYCLTAMKAALRTGARRFECSPITGSVLKLFGDLEGLTYLR